MRSKLFHTIVLCGVALGTSLACSDEDDPAGDDGGKGGKHHCEPGDVAATGGTGAAVGGADAAGAAAELDAGTGVPEGCGGWPPTK